MIYVHFTIYLFLVTLVLGASNSPDLDRRTLTFEPRLQYQIAHNGNSQQVLAGDDADGIPPTYTLRTRPTTVWRPQSFKAVEQARLRSLYDAQSEPIEWVEKVVHGPDVEDRSTLAQLARMAGNAYQLPGRKSWYDMDRSWNINASFPFGWEADEDGFRGFVFRSLDDHTVVLSIKGTTLQGPTSKKDRYNDNLLFSCCCARVDFTWMFSTVCDCYAKHWQCDDTCLSKALIEDSLFYSTGVDLIYNITSLYPSANIWLVGHSLGGAIASLLGSTFGLPAVAFESPGERLAATRLHLPLPPAPASSGPNALPPVPITHVYHNADPIPQGACSGPLSTCAHAGYALETRCHLGRSIIYDTVGRFGWRVDVRKHVIKEVILNVVEFDGGWPGADGVEREVPQTKEEVDCVDCFKWDFGDFKQDILSM